MNVGFIHFWQHPLVETAGYFSVVILCLVVAMVLFEVVTKYKNWEEIKKGNVAVALATGGKILGVCNIFRYSIEQPFNTFGNDWVGIVRIYIAYFWIYFI